MRSDLIFGALTHVNNRYKLCQLASKATRKLHKPNTRLQDTTNEVLDRFKDTIPMDLTVEDGVPAPERLLPRSKTFPHLALLRFTKI
jgi:hypothetical protein